MKRQRKTVAVLCIALVVFSAFLPAGLSDVVWATLTPLWLVVPAVDATVNARDASRSDGVKKRPATTIRRAYNAAHGPT